MSQDIRTQCYIEGMRRALKFCKMNKLPLPEFVTYDEMMNNKLMRHDFARRVMPGASLVGAQTGLYRNGIVYVNVRVTAIPVAQLELAGLQDGSHGRGRGGA